MAHPGFEILEHTADAGIVVHAATPEELFVQSGLGMYAVMTDTADVLARTSREVRAEAADAEHLLVAWLLELLFLTETEHLLFSRFDVRIEDNALRGTAHGEPLDTERHELGAIIKGVTRHLLDVRQEPDGSWRATVLFDV